MDHSDGGSSAGKDQIDGGIGIDTLSFEKVGLGVMLDVSKGDWQTVASGLSYKLAGLENITGSRFADSLVGSAGDNVILAGAGNDTVEGRGGNDRLDGGDGVDTLSFATATRGVSVALAATGVQESGVGRVTVSGFENLTGSAWDDLLAGTAGDNVLRGGGGIDTVSYANASAGVSVSLALTTAQDTRSGGMDTLVSVENLVGSGFADVLKGGSGGNMLDGGDGDDALIGWTGQDYLRGGGGADTFVFCAKTETTVAAPDCILDFSSREADRIDLSQMDANSKTAINDAFNLVAAFTKHAGELSWKAQDGGVLVQGDLNGDGVADFAIQVLGVAKLAGVDFIL